MTLFAGVVFYFGLNNLISRYQINNYQSILDKASILSFSCLGAMFAYSWFLPSPSYNSFNSFALTVSSGLLLGLIGDYQKISFENNLKLRFTLFSIGLCVGISLFVKFTTGIVLFILYGIVISICSKQGIKNKVMDLIILFSGVAVWILSHFMFIQSPVLWWRAFLNGLQFAAATSVGYDTGALTRYINEFGKLGKSALRDFWALHVLILSGFSFIHYCNKSINNIGRQVSVLLGVVFITAVGLSMNRNLYVGGQTHWFDLSRHYLSWILLLMTAVMASLAYTHIHGQKTPRPDLSGMLLGVLLLFCLPFAGAIGTGTPIYINILIYMAPWFGLLLVLVTILSWLHRIQWITPVMGVFFSVFACAQIVTGSLFDPYQLLTGLRGQNQSTEIGYPGTILKIDPITSEYLSQIKAIAYRNGFKPGNDVLAFYDLPGVVFAIGGRSPGWPWHMGGARVASAATALSLVNQERLQRAFILQSSKSEKIMPDLSKFGLDFPNGYIFCGEVNNPYDSSKGTVRLWKPR
jgi:hypothetical protein